MRILVTGSDGQLGQSIRTAAKDSENEYIFYDVDDLDITDPEAVSLGVKCNNFDVIVNCAAFTDVERAEDQEAIAAKVNGDAVAYLAQAAKDNDVTLIHISTDYVYDGNGNTPLSEDARIAPCNAYGRTKLLGEQAIADSGCSALILRTAWLYSEYGHNFVKTMKRLSAERRNLSVVFDQTGTPTYARDLAEAIVAIIDRKLFEGREGTYNYSNDGVCSWFDLASLTARLAGNDGCDIAPCRTVDYPTKAIRPVYTVLDKSKFKNTFGLSIPYWTDSLRKCIDRLKNEN